MDSRKILEILKEPKTITKEQTYGLKKVLEEYPYFQSARAIQLKGLKNEGSYRYNQALKTTAAYTTDRSILFDFITSDTFLQNKISKNIKQNLLYLKDIEVDVETVTVNTSIQLDEALRAQLKDTETVLDPQLFKPKESEEDKDFVQTPEPTDSEIKSAEAILEIGKPLEFDKTETHSFNEWLKLTAYKPIDRTKDLESEDNSTSIQEDSRKKKFDLIDKFISEKPKLVPQKEKASTSNLAQERMIQPEALMTETLARIYVEQKNYEKAIQSYKILSLKYPEKSGFFADQINAVKELQAEQNK